jgi:peptidoglycan/xylan/chitin deacetylase (PgdA/CDA1 family)
VRARGLFAAVAVGTVLVAMAWTADQTQGAERAVTASIATGLPGSVQFSPTGTPSPADTTPPVTVASGVDARWHRHAVTVTLSATDAGSGVAATYVRLDSGPWQTGTSCVVPAPADHRDDGVHTVSYFSVDNAGNSETAQQVTVKIDTTAPRLVWTRLAPAVVRSPRPEVAYFRLAEASGWASRSVRLYDQYGRAVARRAGPRLAADAGGLAVTLRSRGRALVPGLYRLQVMLRDQAGNVSVSAPQAIRDYVPVKAGVTFDLPAAGRRVALTFDDGNDEAAWAAIAATLHAAHVHGTFFVLGPRVEEYAGLARRTIADGDAIGSHGWTHTDMDLQTVAQLRFELTSSMEAWWHVAHATPAPYLRPPYGARDAAVLATAGATGFAHVILWDVDPQDWSGVSSAVVVQRVLSHVHPGAIVCLHTLPNTAAALPRILSGLRAMGYREVSLPELFAAAGEG